MGRSLAFFALAVGSLLVPVVVLWFILRAAPFPYQKVGPDLLDRPDDNEALAHLYFPETKTASVAELGGAKTVAGVGAAWDDGTDAKVAAFEDAYTAALALEGVFDDPGQEIMSLTHGRLYKRGDVLKRDGSTVHIFAWPEDRWLFVLRAPTPELLDARIDRLTFLKRSEVDSLGAKLMRQHFELLVLAFLGWVVIVAPIWVRVASWAATATPIPGAAPVDRAELERRLRSLGRQDGPFAVNFAKDEGTIEWRTDDRVSVQLLAERAPLELERIKLHLDEQDRTVRVRDEEAELEWPPPAADGRLVPPKLDWSAERAIFFFERRTKDRLGVTVESGVPRFDPQYRFQFETPELKEPVIAVITQSGWTYRPVFSFRSRWLFG